MIELPNLFKRKSNSKRDAINHKNTYKENKDELYTLILQAELEIFDVQNNILKFETNLKLPHEIKKNHVNIN